MSVPPMMKQFDDYGTSHNLNLHAELTSYEPVRDLQS